MEQFDFEISHTAINTLHSAYQGKIAALNAAAQMGSPLDPTERTALKTRLDTIGEWGRVLWQDTPLLTKATRQQPTQQAQQAFQMFDDLKVLFYQAADDLETSLSQQQISDDQIYRDLTVAFVWYAYAREHYLKGLLAYCDVMKAAGQAQQYRQILGACQAEIRKAHTFMAAVSGGLQDRKAVWIQLYDATINLPGMFRSQSADIDILRSRYAGKITYAGVHIGEGEAITWSQMGVPADEAAYWKAYGITPEEAAQWKLMKFDDATYTSGWRVRGFQPKQAAEWRTEGFTVKQAALNRDMGYTDPGIARSWQQEAEKQQQRDQEKQVRQEQARAQQVWVEKGFSEEDSAEWKKRGFKDVEIAGQWRKLGLSAEDAQRWKDSGFAVADASQWRYAGFDNPGTAKSFLNADIPASEAARWQQAGFTAHQCASFENITEALTYIALGETPVDAVDWKHIGQSPAWVDAWKTAGVGNWRQAKEWIDKQIEHPDEVVAWIKAGMNLHDADQWRQADFSQEAAIAWRKAGFSSPAEADIWREKGYADPQQAAAEYRKSPECLEAFVTRLMFTSRNNPQEVVLYLGTNTDLLNARFLAAFTAVAQSMMPKGEKERIHFAEAFGWIADCLRRLVNGRPATNVELALGCLLALQDMLKDDMPGRARIQLQFWLAKVLISRHKGDKKQNVEKALSLLLKLDKLVNDVVSPEFWAQVQQALGWGLFERQAGDRRQNLVLAAKRYEAALTVFTSERYPTDHELTHHMQTQAREILQSLKK